MATIKDSATVLATSHAKVGAGVEARNQLIELASKGLVSRGTRLIGSYFNKHAENPFPLGGSTHDIELVSVGTVGNKVAAMLGSPLGGVLKTGVENDELKRLTEPLRAMLEKKGYLATFKIDQPYYENYEGGSYGTAHLVVQLKPKP